jgi:hydrogenase expression/formation protein HypE
MDPRKYVVLDHGTGAKLSQDLIKRITDTLGDVHIGKMEDSAILPISGNQIAVTTDSFVVTPLFFGNGDIGKIAVCGTVNDLAVMGAEPLYLTLAFILEAGFRIEDLLKIVASVRDTALEAGVKIVAGDTKVVNKGEADKIFINTTGVGVFHRTPLSINNVKQGDKFILTGSLGNHSIHILSIREGLGFEKRIVSDCAPLNGVIDALLESELATSVRSIRDVTRGGFAEVMHEYAQATKCNVRFKHDDLPIQAETIMAADMLGVNPIHLANEGCLCIFVAAEKADQVVAFMSQFDYTKDSVVVGEVADHGASGVTMISDDGIFHKLDQLEGAELPRLC